MPEIMSGMEMIDKQKYLFGSVFLLANKLQAIGDHYLGRDGMTTKQWFLTVVISQFGGKAPTLTEVAELMGTSRQNVKQLAIKLEENEFLRIIKDEEDARAVRLVLTEKSHRYWEGRQDKDDQFVKHLFAELGEEELGTMLHCFQKLFGRMEEIQKTYAGG